MPSYKQLSTSKQLGRNGVLGIKRRRSADQYQSERRNTFVINFNGFKNGFRPKNLKNRFSTSQPSSTYSTADFSPPYAVPANLISGTSLTSVNGFHLTSHHQLNGSNIITDVNNDTNDDPNRIVEIESDDSPPYLPSGAFQGNIIPQRPSTVTPKPSPSAPSHLDTVYKSENAAETPDGAKLAEVDFHHQEEERRLQTFHFHAKSTEEEEVSC